MRDRQDDQARQRKHRASRQRQRCGVPICIESDERLKNRGGDLVRQSDDADLTEVQTEIGLKFRIDGRQQRLHHVVQQVTEADGNNYREDSAFGLAHLGSRAGA